MQHGAAADDGPAKRGRAAATDGSEKRDGAAAGAPTAAAARRKGSGGDACGGDGAPTDGPPAPVREPTEAELLQMALDHGTLQVMFTFALSGDCNACAA